MTATMHMDPGKKSFLLDTLYETSRELSVLVQPRQILKNFLLASMGSLGLSCGFATLIDTDARSGSVVHRGLGDDAGRRLEPNLAAISAHFFPVDAAGEDAAAGGPQVPRFVPLEAAGRGRELIPEAVGGLVLARLDEPYAVLVGVGPTIKGSELGAAGRDMLLNLAVILCAALSQALSARRLNNLNADLFKKNEQLEQALQRAQKTRQDLDRRVLHLKSLNDLSVELSPLIQTGKLLESFLLLAMGTFSARQALVVLLDRGAGQVRCARRGLAAVPELSAGQAEQLLYQCLALAENRTLAPMSLSHLEAADVFRDAGFDLEDGPAVMFVVDQSLLGVAALGPTLSGAPVSDAERELLATHVSHLLIYLRNARSFETIQTLNADLERRNLELQRTIDELTRARLHIDILEKARQRIRALVQSQLQRTRSAGWLDFVIIAAASLIVGVLFNFTSPNGIALLPEALLQPDLPAVEVPAAAELISAGKALVVDARPKEFYGLKHIPGAVNLPPGLFDFVYMIKFGSVDLQTPVIVYGRTISRHYDDAVGRRLMQRDHQDVRLLAGGLDAWEEQGYGLEP